MLEILPATIASTEYVSRYIVPMTCLFVPTFAGVLTKYLAELRLCPSSMTDIKMSGPSSHTANKMFGPVLLGGRGSPQEMPGTLRLSMH